MIARRFSRQFRLRTLFAVVTAAACLAGVWSWWDWWTNTRKMRELYQAIQASNMTEEDKRLLGRLAWNHKAWESGLIHDLAGFFTFKRITWEGRFQDASGQVLRVFLLGSIIRKTAGPSFPLTCVVTDADLNLQTSQMVAILNAGFIDAQLSGGGELTITAHTNWTAAKGIYRYQLNRTGIQLAGDERFEKFSEDFRASSWIPHQDDKQLQEISRRLREADSKNWESVP